MPYKYSVTLILFALTIGFTLNNHYGAAFLCFFSMFGFIFSLVLNIKNLEEEEEATDAASGTGFAKSIISKKAFHVYYGDELHFRNDELMAILNKRFAYFTTLTPLLQARFLQRLKQFISNKTFKIHGKDAYKEMPVLFSAAAIQLTFGLEKFLLPHFEFIHFYPEAFMRIEPTICFLEGNVSGHAINLSWKHFLAGYSDGTDGQNVGLHELAHALYYQAFVIGDNIDPDFKTVYDNFIVDANKAYDAEKTLPGSLYSDYAVKNFQEFWAESIEIFFEKPRQMKLTYPKLFSVLCDLLNQDPENKISPIQC